MGSRPAAAMANRTNVEGSGTAAAAVRSAITPALSSMAAPADVFPGAPTVENASLEAASEIGGSAPLLTITDGESPNRAPKTTRPPLAKVRMPVLGTAAGVAKSSVPPLTLVPPV